jgi:diguanylate cyclase (GGDEF)-like protein
MSDETVVLNDIKTALKSTESEAEGLLACLVGVGGELNGTVFDLKEGETSLGRNSDNTIPLEFAGISRYHLKVIVTPEKVLLEDLGSRNGTFLNNNKVEAILELKKADVIKIGSIALKYLPKGDPERLTYDKLHLDANTDGLTQCFNKTYFIKMINLEVKKAKVTGLPLGLILFDLDHFKNLNDTYGHDAGDFTLKTLASIIHSHGVRENDVFARFGGEEFVILLPNTNLKNAFEIAERIRKLIEQYSFIYDGKRLPVTVSVGVADYRQGVSSGTELFKRADQAAYASKEGGRNLTSFFKE